MKLGRVLMTLAVAALVTMPASAQQQKQKKRGGMQLSAPARALARIDKLHKSMEGMELSDDQKAAINKIHEELGPKMKKTLDALKEVLTEEQQEAVEQAAKKAKEAGKEGWQFFRAVDAAFKPTDEQKPKIEKLGKQLNQLQLGVTKKIMAVLNDDQKDVLKKKMAARRGGGKNRAKKK